MSAVRFGRIVPGRSAKVLDAAVPVMVAGVITVGGVLQGGDKWRPLALALGLAAAASLVARRRAPGWTLAISGTLAVILMHVVPEAGPSVVLAPAIALYSLALTRGRRYQLLAAVAIVLAVLGMEAISSGADDLLPAFGHLLLVAIPLLLAETYRTRQAYVLVLRERAELAERTREQEAERRAQEERLRIARDLHDVVAHTLTTINVQAATAAELLDRNPGHARTALETIEDASRDAINELRAILGILREPGANAPTTPAPGVDDVAELVRKTREGGLDVEFEIDGERPERLAETVSLAAFRIVQESLTNARRHAAGAPVRVRLSYEPGALAVSVLNAAGHSANENGSTGVGIAGMAERAAAVGGSLSAEPVPDGFRVAAELPYTPA